MKKIFLLVSIALLLGACSSEQTMPVPEEISGGTRTITFAIGTPKGEPVTYAEHDLPEYKLDKLDVYEFDCTNAAGVLENAVLKKVYKAGDAGYVLGGTQSATDSKRTLTLTLDKADLGKRVFLFVGNATVGTTIAEDLTQLPVGTTTVQQLMNKVTPTLVQGVANINPDFLMTGATAEIDISPEFAGNGTIMMTRVVARIDLGLNLADAGDALVITSAQLKGAPSASNLYPVGKLNEAINALPYTNNAGYVDYAKKTTGLTMTAVTANPFFKSRATKVFYLYERALTQFSTTATPTLFLEGTYTPAGKSAVTVRYQIPFNQSVKRNHLYTFVLGVANNQNAYEGKVLNLLVNQWDDEILLNDGSVSLLKAAAPATGTGYTWDGKHTLTLTAKTAVTLADLVTMTSGFADNDTYSVVKTNWTAAPNTKPGQIENPNNGWITAAVGSAPDKITIGATENTGAAREGIIWIKSDKDTNSDVLYWIKVKQN